VSTTLHLLGWIAALVPRATGLPQTIEPTDTFSGLGLGATFGSMIRPSASPALRVDLIRRWGMVGFCTVAAIYGFAVTYPLL
jgi:hypothetical protein